MCFCQSCWLRMSGFYYWMFKPRSSVFLIPWLKRQSGLCLLMSHLPSRFPVKVLCHVLLIWGVTMEPAVPSILTMQAWWWRWELDLSLPTDSSLSDSPFCSLFIDGALWKIQPEFLASDRSLAISSPVLFSRWSSAGPPRSPFSTNSCAVYHSTSSVLSLLSKGKASGKNKMCFAIWRKVDKITTLGIHFYLEAVWLKKKKIYGLWQAEDAIALEHRSS